MHEPWWTPTARRADIVLPATTTLERNDVGGSSRDRYILAMRQALAPVGHSRNDFDIYRELAAMAGFEQVYTEGRDEMAWIRHIYEQMRPAWEAQQLTLPDFDAFWERGHVALPEPPRDFVLFEQFRADPQAHPLKTASGKLELHSEALAGFGYADCPPHPAWLPPAEWLGAEAAREWPLHLVTCQPAGRLHSQLDQSNAAREAEIAGREPVRMHPADAPRAASARGRGAPVQRTRRLPGRRRPGRGRGARGGGHGHGRLVRPARRGAGAPRQSERADPGRGHLAAGAGLQRAVGPGSGGKWAGGPEPVRVFEPPALARLAG